MIPEDNKLDDYDPRQAAKAAFVEKGIKGVRDTRAQMWGAIRAIAAAATPLYILRDANTGILYRRYVGNGTVAFSVESGARKFAESHTPGGCLIREMYDVRMITRADFLAEISGEPYVLDGRIVTPKEGDANAS